MSTQDRIEAFLAGRPHAVVGASRDRNKYGNKVLRAYHREGRPVYPVNPAAEEVEGLDAYPDLTSLPQRPHGVSIVTPPAVTLNVVKEAAGLGIKHVWMQPGAESDEAVQEALEHGMNVIGGDACVLVALA